MFTTWLKKNCVLICILSFGLISCNSGHRQDSYSPRSPQFLRTPSGKAIEPASHVSLPPQFERPNPLRRQYLFRNHNSFFRLQRIWKHNLSTKNKDVF